MSDPIQDLRDAFDAILNEKWICKNCGWYTTLPPKYGIKVCPDCGSTEWHYSASALPEV